MKLSLADIFQLKYGFYCLAAERAARIVLDIKQSIKDMYNNYINGRRDNTIAHLAQTGDKTCQKIIRTFEVLLGNLDDLSIDELFKILNKLLESVFFIIKDPERATMNALWDSVIIKNQADKNRRAHLKRTFEGNLARLSSILEKQLIILKKISLTNEDVKGTRHDPERKQLSPKDFYDFTFTSEAAELGLDDLKILTKILEDSKSKETLTTIINALKRGKNPKDWNQIKNEAAELIAKHKELTSGNNSDLFEDEE